MRTLRICLLGVSFFIVAGAVSPAGAQTVAVGPYYAVPSWDQSLPASTRFVVLTNFNNAAVLDRETGLVWERAPSSTAFPIVTPPNQFGGSTAWERCINLNIANHMGWRVPTIQELTTLLDKSQSPVSLPAGHPFTVVTRDPNPPNDPFHYWSSTQFQNGFNLLAYRYVQFEPGATGAGGITAQVWCVRGGAGTPVQ